GQSLGWWSGMAWPRATAVGDRPSKRHWRDESVAGSDGSHAGCGELGCQRAAVGDAQLEIDIGEVEFDRLTTHVQASSGFGIRQTARDQMRHLSFSLAQLAGPVPPVS